MIEIKILINQSSVQPVNLNCTLSKNIAYILPKKKERKTVMEMQTATSRPLKQKKKTYITWNHHFQRTDVNFKMCPDALGQQIIIGNKGSALSRPPLCSAACTLPSPWLVSIKWTVLLAAEACVACLPWVQMMSGPPAGYRHCRLLITSGGKKRKRRRKRPHRCSRTSGVSISRERKVALET